MVFGIGKKDDEKAAEKSAESDGESGSEMAESKDLAQEIIDAVHDGDAESVAHALDAYFAACMEKHSKNNNGDY